MEDVSYSWGETPIEVIRERLPESYPMQLAGEDAEVVQRLVNQGIDAHLEACFIPDRGDSYAWEEHKLDSGTVIAVKLHCSVSAESMLVLLRRMEEDETPEADSLRVAILSTLNIEEV